MLVKEKVRGRVTQVYMDNSPNVYKGNDYDGQIQAFGWWYKPFNSTPIFLGTSLAEVLEMLDQVENADLF